MEFLVPDTDLQELYQQWQEQDEGALLLYTLSFWDVKTLLHKQKVNKTWQKSFKESIHVKCGPDRPKAFKLNQELKDAVKK
jgi:hypothetical protein